MRRSYWRTVLAACFLVVLSGRGWSADDAFRVERDLQYKSSGTDYELERGKLDLYLPADKQGFATLVWFHGGGLKAGDKGGEFALRVGRRLAREGIAVAIPNYRLSPQVNFPAYVEDAAAATAWVKANIDNYEGDPKRLFVSGHSAGGYLTAMLALAGDYLRKVGMSPDEVRGFVPISGQMDSHSQVRTERGKSRDQSVVDESAPLFHVSPTAPPLLVIVGGEDLPEREEINRRIANQLAEVGHKSTELLVVLDRTHSSIVSRINEPDDAVATRLLEFIRYYLRDDLPLRVAVGTTEPLHQCGNVYLAGQPSPEDLEEFRQRGVKTILSLRTAGEVQWDEAASAQAAGLEFLRIPFRGADTLTDEVFDKALAVLREAESQPVVLHCGGANRVGAIWMAYRVLDDGLTVEAAQQEAEATGLRTPAYAERAKEYIHERMDE